MSKRITTLGLFISIAILSAACVQQQPTNGPNSNASSPSPATATSPSAASKSVPVTLPVLDALFADEGFRTALKTKVELSVDQMAQLQKIASEEVAKLRQLNTEGPNAVSSPEADSQAELSRERAADSIRGAIGEQKAEQLFALARDYWVAGGQTLGTGKDANAQATPESLPNVPNTVPKDTRIVVNIPAFRMDVFKDGALVKSYKIGIGYPEFPLPTGVRKAETIIFNPTWTPPDEPWVAHMKNVSVGEAVPAGSKLNPLGPIKIPIGAPSLIHGGKSLAKIGTFASHGCVGLTTPQIRDFAKVLADASGTTLTDQKIQAYLKNPTRTQALKLAQVVPVELRYETIVVEDGKLHVYRDVYAQDTNNEENLRAVLQANGTSLEDLSEDERTQALDAVNAMSRHPKKVTPKPTASVTPTSPADKTAKAAPTPKPAKPIKNQKEIVIELAKLSGRGYPAAVALDTGSGKPATPAATPGSGATK
ncbi:MAG TPA: L,D-transpeptidase [Pyrinomonadaceae bacterium]|nr:L,D-transpeptidase [Pyrinomonadaceae bacterium]